MSSSTLQAPIKTGRYHHGDLKNALLVAARELAYELGVDHFTLREVARRAQVSPAAPYHHFSDKQDLMRALALEAFEKLTQVVLVAKQTKQHPLEQIEEIGIAYVRFAFDHLAEFRFMFRRELCAPVGEPDPLEQAGRESQAVLYQTILEAQAIDALKNQAPQDIAMTLWSVVHGLSMILLETPISKDATANMATTMARNVIRQTLEGLAT